MQITIPAIVIVAYNRPVALNRILKSIAAANYENYNNINLLISIDGGGSRNKEVNQIAQSFFWEYGEKKIIIHEKNIGLRNHVISCGDLTAQYENLIILEEDSYVSHNYFNFAIQSLSYYYSNKRIAGISLYSYQYYESFETYFRPIIDGHDAYFMQVPSSLGQSWTKKQWFEFKEWYNKNPTIFNTDKIPERVKTWSENSWKKYFYKYMVERDLFFVYPQISHATNFGEAGTNISGQTLVYHVTLENYLKGKKYNLPLFEESNNKYDAYYEILPECLIANGVNIDPDTCIDLMGSKPLNLFTNKFALSCKNCNNSFQNYNNILHPIIQNVLFQINGDSIHYALRENFGKIPPDVQLKQIANAQPLGFTAGKYLISTSKYYKLGFYLLKPWKILFMLKRKILSCFSKEKFIKA